MRTGLFVYIDNVYDVFSAGEVQPALNTLIPSAACTTYLAQAKCSLQFSTLIPTTLVVMRVVEQFDTQLTSL